MLEQSQCVIQDKNQVSDLTDPAAVDVFDHVADNVGVEVDNVDLGAAVLRHVVREHRLKHRRPATTWKGSMEFRTIGSSMYIFQNHPFVTFS